jgi:hypothetical protein
MAHWQKCFFPTISYPFPQGALLVCSKSGFAIPNVPNVVNATLRVGIIWEIERIARQTRSGTYFQTGRSIATPRIIQFENKADNCTTLEMPVLSKQVSTQLDRFYKALRPNLHRLLVLVK